MKRSDMLAVIEQNILETKGQLNAYQLAERILNRIEELGMEAPHNENWMSLDVCREFYGDRDNYNDVPRKNINRWDSEDILD